MFDLQLKPSCQRPYGKVQWLLAQVLPQLEVELDLRLKFGQNRFVLKPKAFWRDEAQVLPLP